MVEKSSVWYYYFSQVANPDTHGPVDDLQMATLISSGKISKQDMVKEAQHTNGRWKFAGNVVVLAVHFVD